MPVLRGTGDSCQFITTRVCWMLVSSPRFTGPVKLDPSFLLWKISELHDGPSRDNRKRPSSRKFFIPRFRLSR
eukprot:scaffold45444_cov168-Amphora_coffeaeformis.AAC.2